MHELKAAVARCCLQEERDGARASGGRANGERVIKLLTEALATKILCILRYKRHYYRIVGNDARHVKGQFLQLVTEEQAHADHLAIRIVQLGGRLDVSPTQLLNRNDAEHVEGDSVGEILRADLLAERISIEDYRARLAALGDEDPTTRQVLEWIQAQEEAHLERLAGLVSNCSHEVRA